MKILFANKYNFLKGGSDKYMLDLRGLLEKCGHETGIFAMRHPDNLPDKHEKYFVSYIDFNNFKVRDLFKYVGRIFYSFEAARNFRSLVNEFKPDILHVQNIYHQISPSILTVAKKQGIKIVMHLNDYKLLCPNYKMFNWSGICEKCRGGKYYNCVLNKCLKDSYAKSLLASLEMYFHHKVLKIYEKNVDLYIAPSEFVRQKAIEWGIDEEKIRVLPYFIKTDDYTPDFSPGDYFLFFGRLSEEKGIAMMLDAYSRLDTDVKLKIAGSGPEKEMIQKKIEELNIEDRVEMLGFVKGPNLVELIKHSLAAIVPSEWHEVTGIVNYEAQLLGKSVIAARTGGIPEALLDGKSGFLFERSSVSSLMEKMDYILKNKEKAALWGKAGHEYILANFSEKSHYIKLLELYSGLIDVK